MKTNLIAARHLISATALCAGLATVPAHGATLAAATTDNNQTANGGLAEITVTAQKRTENLEKTPISISVLSSEDLENRHVQSLTDLGDGSAPGLRVMPYASRPFNVILNIRGIGIMTDTNQPARDPGVGVYIDGVYLGRPQGLDAALYDLESIEVLKGPQGTLFGRNTEAGALNITTKKPTGRFDLSVTGGVGNYGSHEAEVHLDLPEWHNFSVKVDGVINAHDGYVKNKMVGASDWGAASRRGLRTQLQWRPAPNFTANYAFDTSHTADTTLYDYQVQAGTTPVAAITPPQSHRVSVGVIGVPLTPSIGKQFGHTLNLKWEVSPALTIKSISSYRQLYQNQFQAPSGEATPAPTTAAAQQFERYSLAEFHQHQYSEELQAIGEIGRLKYIFGGLAYHESVHDQAQAFYSMQFDSLGAGTSASPIPYGPDNIANLDGQSSVTDLVDPLYPYAGVDRASRVSTNSYGIYGQATWTPPVFNDIAHLTGGLRWTDDRKDGQLYVVNNALPVDALGNSGVLGFKKSWSRVDPMVNLAIDLAHGTQIYGKWSTGYKSGGANSRSLTYLPFNPEEVSMFEVGLKSEFLNHHARFNIALYTGSYTNIQYDYSAPYYNLNPDGSISTKGTRTTTDTINAPGSGRVSGVETDLMLAPFRGLTLSGSYTYSYVRMPDALNPFPTYVPGTGMVFATQATTFHQLYTPKHAVTGAIDYETHLEDLTLRAHLDANWNSGYYTTSSDIAVGKDSAGNTVYAPQYRSQPGFVFNGRFSVGDIALASSGAKLTVSLWVRNLFNEAHMITRSESSVGNGVTGLFNDPRTFGVQGNIKF